MDVAIAIMEISGGVFLLFFQPLYSDCLMQDESVTVIGPLSSSIQHFLYLIIFSYSIYGISCTYSGGRRNKNEVIFIKKK